MNDGSSMGVDVDRTGKVVDRATWSTRGDFVTRRVSTRKESNGEVSVIASKFPESSAVGCGSLMVAMKDTGAGIELHCFWFMQCHRLRGRQLIQS